MYSPGLGRFLQTDPIGTTDDLNLYAYVKNNPVNLTDPMGLIASSSGNFASTTAVAPANGPKFDGAAFSMPASQMGDAIQVAGVKNGDTMGGNLRENKQFQRRCEASLRQVSSPRTAWCNYQTRNGLPRDTSNWNRHVW
jgi:uncharacterized protein RhaS with RHS repeats